MSETILPTSGVPAPAAAGTPAASETPAGITPAAVAAPATVGELERALLSAVPASDAEHWDRVGLSVGDPSATLTGVACALDVTPENIRAARAAGANVLLTHHPVCLSMPARICPQSAGTPTPASSIWEAVASGVSLIALHTNLDRATQATLAIPRALGIEATSGLERHRPAGAGRLGSTATLEEPLALRELARRCRETFGRLSQVFGDPDAPVRRVAFYTGSMGGEGCADVVAARVDVAICGECGYHRALDLVSGGTAVIILGHDVSELPLVACLRDVALSCGVAPERLCILPEPHRWF